MQIIGLYDSFGVASLLISFNELRNAQIPLPIILSLSSLAFFPRVDGITIFPALLSADRRATIHQALIQSFRKDQGFDMVAKMDDIDTLIIYLIDSSDMPFVYALAKDMAVSFPKIRYLDLLFRSPSRCEIVSFLLTVDDCNRT